MKVQHSFKSFSCSLLCIIFISVIETEEEIRKRSKIEECLQRHQESLPQSLQTWQTLAIEKLGLVGGCLLKYPICK